MAIKVTFDCMKGHDITFIQDEKTLDFVIQRKEQQYSTARCGDFLKSSKRKSQLCTDCSHCGATEVFD